MVLFAALASAATSASSFASDAGDWEGGTVVDGVLRLDGEAAVLDPGEVTRFDFTALMRLAAGDGFSVRLSDACTLTADYGGAGEVSFGGASQPFPVMELGYLPDASPLLSGSGGAEAGGIGDPDVVRFNGEWWMFYTATDASGATSVHAATSTDLENWTRRADTVLGGAAQPDAVVVDGELVVFYASGGQLWRTASADGVSFDYPSVVLSPGTGFDASGLGHPSVVVDEGTWWLWYAVPATGATGSATSASGTTFTRDAELSADNGRLFGVDVQDATLGLEGLYSLLDSVGFAVGGDDTRFADDGADVRPLFSMNDTAWSDGGFGTGSLARNGSDLHLFVDALRDGSRVIGRVGSVPMPGTFGVLSLSWDGSAALASWNGGPGMACTLDTFDGIVITADGRVELDETSLEYAGKSVGDSGDTAALLDTSGDPSGDSGLDSADTGSAGLNAGEWLGEPGGCGCASARPPLASLPLLLLLTRARRRSPRST
jgi:hypothetical protein